MTLRELLKAVEDRRINLDSEISIRCTGVLTDLDFFSAITSAEAYHFDEGEHTEKWILLLNPERSLGY